MQPVTANVAFLVILVGCGSPPPEVELDLRRRVSVVEVVDAPAFRERALLAVTEPIRDVRLGPLRAGRLVRRANRGDVVARGDVLLALDAREAQARRDAAEAAHQDAVLQAERADRSLQRLRQLADGASPADLDDAETGLARASVAVDAAAAQLTLAKLEVEHMTLRAPFAGEVVSVGAEVGELVGAGTPLVRVVDNTSARLDVGLVADELELARDGRTTWRVRGPSGVYDASLASLAPAADARTLDWRAELLVTDAPLAAGLPVDVELRLPIDAATGVVPYAALMDEERAVWAISSGKVSRVEIRVEAEVPGGVAVSGVAPGQQVVVYGGHGLRDEEEVVVLDDAP